MKNILVMLGSFLVLGLEAQAQNKFYAMGGDSSGGGRGVFCSDPTNPHHGRLLDLYESYALWQLRPMNPTMTYDEAVTVIAPKMAELFVDAEHTQFQRDIGTKGLTEFFLQKKEVRFIPGDQSLVPINDSLEPVTPIGCEIKQVAIFYSNQLLLVDGTLWNQLRDLDKVALLAHEIIYFNLREQGAVDSRYTRRLVGKLFSLEPMEYPIHGMENLKEYYSCKGGIEGFNRNFKFYLFDQCVENRCQAVAQFITFSSGQVFEKTIAKLGRSLEEIAQTDSELLGFEMQIGFRNHYLRFDLNDGLRSIEVQSTNSNGLFDAPRTHVLCDLKKR